MVQEALARVMATTGLPGISAFLRQALQHPNPDLRTAALLGLAALPEDVDVSTFEKALSDEDSVVRETAVRGLAALETAAAQQSLEMILREEEDSLRAIAAEELVGYGRENLELLRELVKSEDMVARRAAVFGLHKAGEREMLVRLARDDEQWAVRTAAAAAIEELDEHPFPVIEPPPRPEHMPWLVSWAASQGKGVGMGEAAEEILRLALEKGDSTVRLAAALVLAQAGGPDDVDLLRTVLGDPDPFTAGVALEALAEIGRRHDLVIERRAS
jgi:HEAT repeat protein